MPAIVIELLPTGSCLTAVGARLLPPRLWRPAIRSSSMVFRARFKRSRTNGALDETPEMASRGLHAAVR